MHPWLAERTCFNDGDAEVIKKILLKMYENDEPAARLAGSMEVIKLICWKHNCLSG